MGEIDYTADLAIRAISEKQDELSSDDRLEIECFVYDRITEQSLNKIKTYADWGNRYLNKLTLMNKELADHYDKVGNVEQAGYYAYRFTRNLYGACREYGGLVEKQEEELNKYCEIAMKSTKYGDYVNGTFSMWRLLKDSRVLEQSEDAINQTLDGTSLPDHQ